MPSFPVKSVFLGPCLYFLLRYHELRPALLRCLIASDWSCNYREHMALSSESLWNSLTQLQFFFLFRHSPLQHRVAFNPDEVSVLAAVVKTFADEFFGVESSQPAVLSIHYQIQQTVCFCHNSLSAHFFLISPSPPLLTQPRLRMHTPPLHSPVQKLLQKLTPLVWIPVECKGHYNSHTQRLWLHMKTLADPPAGRARCLHSCSHCLLSRLST